MIKKIDIGKVEFFSLNIATVYRSLAEIAEVYPTAPSDLLNTAFEGGEMEWAFNAALIRMKGHNILVDTGFGFSSGEQGAGIGELIAETGISAKEITEIVITHGHGDHVGGLVENGEPTMPGAKLVIHEAEHRFFTGGEAARLMGEEAIQLQNRAFSAYADRTVTVGDGDIVASTADGEVRVIEAAGHTPGHICLEINSQNKRLWLLVDTLHALFQLDHPEWSPRYDIDPDLAHRVRVDLLGKAADKKIPVMLYHFPFPGLGTVRRAGDRFTYSE